MTSGFGALIIGILATVLYELMKQFFLFIWFQKEEKISTFNVVGYWISYQKINGYEVCELVHIKRKYRELKMRIYQIINDGRKYEYKGKGIVRFDKLIIPYEEVTKRKSDYLGVLMLRFSNELEHSIFLKGKYFEFKKDRMEAKGYHYKLKEFEIGFADKVKIKLLGKNFAYELLERKKYGN